MKTFIFSLFMVSSLIMLNAQNNGNKLMTEENTYTSASGKSFQGIAGSLKVPENRTNPASDQINIYFVHLKSSNPNPGTPIIYLDGGPGSSCTWQAGNKYYMDYWASFLEDRDVVLLDQRGTGKGTERVRYLWREAVPEGVFVDAEIAKKHYKNIAQKALPEFKKRGVDLKGYTTKENATDVDELRKALGFSKINLFGFSYGTHLGQAYLRYFEEQVDRAVLVGVEGPDHTFKPPYAMDLQLKKIAALAKQDPALSKDLPDLEALYKRVIKKLEKSPVEVSVINPISRQAVPVKVGAFGLNMLLRFDIGDASDLPVFPRLLAEIDKGEYSSLQWFTQKRYRNVFGLQAMSATMDIASGISPERRLMIKEQKRKSFFGNEVNFTLDIMDQLQGFWPIPDLGEEFRSPLVTAVPTLFMSGTLDFNTPPYQAEEVRWGYANSSHIIVKNAGHEQIITHPGSVPAIRAFLKGEDVDQIALAQPPLKFIPLNGKSGDLWHPALGDKN